MKTTFFNNKYLKVFFIGFFTAFCIFLPFLIIDKGFFTYAGDFNSQQIPFYMYANNIIRSGGASFSWATDLGSSFVNSYSFYLLGSPFFWLTCLFDYKFIPYLMPFLLMLKFAFATLGAFLFLKRYAKNDNFALVGSILYAFCGFGIYNVFFNHFLESFAFFPFLLWALDAFIYEDKKGIFPLFVALNLINNYFFFIGQVVFLFIYFICKIVSKEYTLNIKKFFNLAFEAVTGCFMGIALFIPSIFLLLDNPRVGNTLKDFGIWMYTNVQQYFAIITSALLPPDPPYTPSLFTNGSIKWTSLSAFIALGGLFGYFVFLKYNKKSSFFKTFTVCIVFAFVPILNSMFYAFNASYYARWFYIPLLILVAMNMQSFNFSKEKIYTGIKTTAILTCLLLVFALTPTQVDGNFKIGLASQSSIFWVNFLIAILSLYLLYVIVSNYHNTKKYANKLLAASLAIIFIFATLHFSLTKMPQWEHDKLYKPQNYDILQTFDLEDDMSNFRTDTYNCYDNLGLFTNLPNIQFFNSTVSGSIMEFYPSIGVKRDVSSKPDHSLTALRSLLSVKYLIMPQWEVSSASNKNYLLNYSEYKSEYPYSIYENDNFIPMGFTYDKYVTYDKLEPITKTNRSTILLRAIAVDSEVVEKYGLQIPILDDDELYDYTYNSTLIDIENRKKESSYYFNQTNTGFDCKINLSQDNLVFFSVPYDKGFTAYVNGEETEIIKVSYGMSAVFAPAGDNEITFVYKTYGLNLGIILSILGCIVYLTYIFYIKKLKIKD